MKLNNILFILIQIDEAHSSEWPIGLENQPEPQKDIAERLKKANSFCKIDLLLESSKSSKYSEVFPVYVDTWTNEFAETYHAWPDKYHMIDENMNILQASTYGNGHDGNPDALIILDALDLINQMLS